MSDNSFQAFFEELKLLVEKFEKKQMQIKFESDLDYDSVKIFGEKIPSFKGDFPFFATRDSEKLVF